MIPAIAIQSMTGAAISGVRELERLNAQLPQVPATTFHLVHAGLYARTITIPAKSLLTGALIKIATVLIVSGDVDVTLGDGVTRLTGYHVLAAQAGRKQAFLAHADTQLTMVFATSSKDIQHIEDEFTDEADLLFSRKGENIVTITGDTS